MKDTYYFSHDSNARNDTKITKMINKYGMRGYGIYWVIVEMLREQNDFKLNKDDCIAIALQSHESYRNVKRFLYDCINEFKLFKSTNGKFYSESLLKRMEKYKEKCDKYRKNIEKRWEDERKKQSIPSYNDCTVNKVKESKLNNNKEKEIYKEKESFTPKEKYNYFKGMDKERKWNKEKSKREDQEYPPEYHLALSCAESKNYKCDVADYNNAMCVICDKYQILKEKK